MNQFFLISLCNFSYKVVTKILAKRLRKHLVSMISPNQGAFVARRWIAENMVITQELTHKVRKHKGNGGLMIIILDLEKAYNRLKWNILELVLRAWSFARKFIHLITSCVQMVNFRLLINGSLSGHIFPS